LAGLEIIGAGFGRTGTTSLKRALEHLGYKCYHMEEVPRNLDHGHLEHWYDKYEGKPGLPFEEVFERYTATVDFPGCTYYRELMDVYPDAKVLLSVRDSESWWKSFDALMKTNESMRYLFFMPKIHKFYRMVLRLQNVVFGGRPDKDLYIRVYEQHNADAQANVPPEKLLVFNVKEGWEPLCRFLGKPVPEIPFPHANAGMDDIKAKIRKAIFRSFTQPFTRRSRRTLID
jgi:hypothetical protein